MKLKITVHGVAYEVDVEVLDAKDEFAPAAPLPSRAPVAAGPSAAASAPPPAARPAPGPGAAAAGSVVSPIAGTVVEVKCKPGDQVTEGQVLLVIEAMKMNTSISAPSAGTVKAVPKAAGDTVRENEVLVEFE